MIKKLNFSDPNILKLDLPFHVMTGYDLSFQLSKNFTLKELFDATRVHPLEKPLNFLPIHKNAIPVAQYLRDQLNVAINIGSAFRSSAYEVTKDRSVDGSHTKALAIDLNTTDKSVLIDFLLNAYNTKNHVYQKLRSYGVNSFGFYDWGVHLDFRPRKLNDTDRFWDFRTKKKNSYFTLLIWLIPFSFLMYKNRYRFKTIKRLIKK